jgi:hypothetical protein
LLVVLATILVIWILFKIITPALAAANIPSPWDQIIYWVIVLIIVLWLLSHLGIMQPIIR